MSYAFNLGLYGRFVNSLQGAGVCRVLRSRSFGFGGSNTSGFKHELGAALSPSLGSAINQTWLFGFDLNVQGFTLGLVGVVLWQTEKSPG